MDRFLKHFKESGPDECWVWGGPVNHCGYGIFTSIDSKLKLSKSQVAHRFSLMVSGVTIPLGIKACHKCDNPPCCNPGHIFLGTQKENVQDMFYKKRDNHARGIRCSMSKLTDELVREIKSLGNLSWSECMKISHRYGVHGATIRAILIGKTWRHIQ